MGNSQKAKISTIRDYEIFMAKKMTDAAVKMDTRLFEKWLRLVVRRRAANGDVRAQEMLERAELEMEDDNT